MEKPQCSSPLSPDELARLAPAAFTTLPVRINRHDQQARKSSFHFVKAWRDASQQSPLSKQSTINWENLSSSSPIGHLASLVHPECRPELLVFMAKVFDYAQIHHEIVQPGNESIAKPSLTPESNPQSQAPSEPEAADTLAAMLSPNPVYKRIQLSLASELMEVHEDNLQAALDSASVVVKAIWLNQQDACEPTTFDQYFLSQQAKGKALETTLLLEVDLRPTSAELVCAEDVLAPLRVAQTLALEYFSYVQTVEEQNVGTTSSLSSSLPTKGVPLLMAEHGISKKEALAILQRKIVAAEQEHSDNYISFSEDKTMPDNIRQYVELIRLATGGLHVWASCTPRYQRNAMRSENAKGAGLIGTNYERLSWIGPRSGSGFVLGFWILIVVLVFLAQGAFSSSYRFRL
ncbi:hypothetical protein ASPCAL02774 [Aspergillus calidoustus]|uniref:Uncharacterized protein n=1 Tax=Aspergillus calidoustus TaxID=454130 RepID=A0A0U4ZW79_ASPCI|nr:hypothetical protein ASPCAL02774 [Aspergillus calidoustus]